MSVTVTVLMPVFNGAKYLREAVESILQQSHREFDFLIVDDGSTDETRSLLKEYASRDNRVRIIRHTHLGLVHSLNRGLKEARGEFIIRMDADDIAFPQRIERQVAYLTAHPDIAAVGSSIQYINQRGVPTHVGQYAVSPEDVFKALHEGNSPIAHPAAAMRKSRVLEVGGYRPLFVHAEDFDLWQRLADRYAIANLPDVLLKYRVHDANVSKVHHFRQSLSGYAARYAAEERRKGKPDPLIDATVLSISSLDRFELPPKEREPVLRYLTEAALTDYEAGHDPALLNAAEEGLVRLAALGSRKARPLATRAAEHHLRHGNLLSAAVDLGKGILPIGHAGRALKTIGSWPATVSQHRRVAGALVHGADPANQHIAPAFKLRTEDLRALLKEANAHGVLPAVARSIRPLAAEIPGFEAATATAAAQLLMLQTHSMMLRGFADTLLGELSGQPVTLIKGLAFARAIYPSPQLRPFTDIDLLVAPEAKSRVEDALRGLGFMFAAESHDAARREDKWLHKKNSTLLVEIHTNMVHAPSLQGALTLSYEDLALDGPGKPAAHLMIALLHGSLHQFESLRQVVDILQATRGLRTPADEQELQILAGRTGGRLAAVAGLELAWRMFGEERCREIARGLGPVKRAALARLFISRAVVLSMTTEHRLYYTWRRQGFRELLKRGSIVTGAPSAGKTWSCRSPIEDGPIRRDQSCGQT